MNRPLTAYYTAFYEAFASRLYPVFAVSSEADAQTAEESLHLTYNRDVHGSLVQHRHMPRVQHSFTHFGYAYSH